MRRFGPEWRLEDEVMEQAVREGSSLLDRKDRETVAEAHINSLTNWELVKLISRALED